MVDLGFLSLRFLDILDIILLATILFVLYKSIKGQLAFTFFFGFLIIYLIGVVTRALNMRLLSTLLNQLISIGSLALIVVFQQEIRRWMISLGQSNVGQSRKSKNRFSLKWNFKYMQEEELPWEEFAIACKQMSKERLGAIIVFARSTELKFFATTGIPIDAQISSRLILTIFNKNSPMHDGAVIVVQGMLKAASCILPVSDRAELPAQFGLRHRSAMGIAEQTDALAVVVSEETGNITLFSRGRYIVAPPDENLALLLNREFLEQ